MIVFVDEASESTVHDEDADTASHVSLDQLPHLGQLPGSTPVSMVTAGRTQQPGKGPSKLLQNADGEPCIVFLILNQKCLNTFINNCFL